MSYGIGGYQLIDFKGIDLINEETLNNSVYEQIEKANKNKPLCIVNIVKDKIEYQAQFINVNIDNSNFTFYLLDRFIKVSPSKVESLPLVASFNGQGVKDDSINIDDDFISYNHTMIITYNNLNVITNFSIINDEGTKEPYNIIFTNPNAIFTYQVGTTPSNNRQIDFESWHYNLIENEYFLDISMKLFNLIQIVIKVIDKNIYVNFITNTEL